MDLPEYIIYRGEDRESWVQVRLSPYWYDVDGGWKGYWHLSRGTESHLEEIDSLKITEPSMDGMMLDVVTRAAELAVELGWMPPAVRGKYPLFSRMRRECTSEP